eukprot:gnl/Hemi2/15392_TR5179_c0_g1_i1.p1 gnl/Hemi2/15392_TR5179_c0_g1~~gnl/Hemi2/15392_TR5179_c0_g1_i1.p1  ORF type:complete len:315 (+),score=53.86 gnl/Hemi2/15392_TR5179_c0_g1_i1:66-1010(+)
MLRVALALLCLVCAGSPGFVAAMNEQPTGAQISKISGDGDELVDAERVQQQQLLPQPLVAADDEEVAKEAEEEEEVSTEPSPAMVALKRLLVTPSKLRALYDSSFAVRSDKSALKLVKDSQLSTSLVISNCVTTLQALRRFFLPDAKPLPYFLPKDYNAFQDWVENLSLSNFEDQETQTLKRHLAISVRYWSCCETMQHAFMVLVYLPPGGKAPQDTRWLPLMSWNQEYTLADYLSGKQSRGPSPLPEQGLTYAGFKDLLVDWRATNNRGMTIPIFFTRVTVTHPLNREPTGSDTKYFSWDVNLFDAPDCCGEG